MPLPGCDIPDEARFGQGLKDTRCDDDSECGADEVCTYATPRWLCVHAELPRWLGIYTLDPDDCAFSDGAQVTTDCPVVGAWTRDGLPAWLEQCPDSSESRLCTPSGCRQAPGTNGMTLISASPCPVLEGTALLFRNDQNWPPQLVAYRHDDAGLTEFGRLDSEWYYMENNPTGIGFVCTDDDLVLVSPQSLMRYRAGSLERLLPMSALPPIFGRTGEIWGRFDGVTVDRKDAKLLHIGVVTSYEVHLLTWKLGEGSTWARSVPTDDQALQALPGGDGQWLIRTSAGCFMTRKGLDLDPWFVPGANETVIGLNAEGWALTRTLTRVFRRPPASDGSPYALDAGLPFPGEYMYYLPAIRHLFVQSGSREYMTIVLQYRPTGG